jgi:organic hydroperoxide reductase OsmC/OhrA
LRSLEIEVKGNLDMRVFLGLTEGHAGYGNIEVTTSVDCDADEQTLRALHDAVVKTSPVGHAVAHPVEVQSHLVKI